MTSRTTPLVWVVSGLCACVYSVGVRGKLSSDQLEDMTLETVQDPPPVVSVFDLMWDPDADSAHIGWLALLLLCVGVRATRGPGTERL